MATVVEIAERAGVSAEQVLRVLGGEPVSEATADRVRVAVATLEAASRAAALERPLEDRPAIRGPAAGAVDGDVAGEFGSLVYEAVRVEVRPVVERVGAIDALFREVLGGLRAVAAEVAAERRDRVADLELQVELIRSAWTSVDRRLGRLERMIERQATGQAPATPGIGRQQPAERRHVTRFGRRPDVNGNGGASAPHTNGA